MRSKFNIKPRPSLTWLACLAFLVAGFTLIKPVLHARSMGSLQQGSGIIGDPVSLSNLNPFISPLYSGCGGVTPPPSTNPDFEQQVVELVNNARLSQGLFPLKRVDLLNNSSRYHAIDMAQDNYFEHDTYDRTGGTLTLVCAWYARLISYYSPNWQFLAENIAAGYPDPTSVMNGWMGSTGHRDNILSDAVWEMGVGYYFGGAYGTYWVQDFGKRPGIYPLTINREAATTTSRQVVINIDGVFTQMRLHNDAEPFGNWQTFHNQFSWRLACGVGTHTVTAEVKGSDGIVYSTNDSIQLTVSGCPNLGGMPETLTFLASTTESQVFYPSFFKLIPANTVSDELITWSLSQNGTWFTLNPTSGTTPGSFQVTPQGVFSSPGTFIGSITVTATAPGTTEGTPKTINVKLIVLDYPLFKLYMPNMYR